MPDTGPVIYALAAMGVECPQLADMGCFTRSGDNDKPVVILHRDKRLGSQRVTFDHAYGNRLWPWLSSENTDNRFASLRGNVDTGEIVKSLCRSLID